MKEKRERERGKEEKEVGGRRKEGERKGGRKEERREEGKEGGRKPQKQKTKAGWDSIHSSRTLSVKQDTASIR